MQRLPVMILLAAVLGGCASHKPRPHGPAAAPIVSRSTAPLDANGTPIEKLPFRLGVSSNTVEKMARQQACTGGQGAGLVTEPGPVEVYRMQCDNGRVYMARCELRQCRQM
jgi:hypothetical protein